MKTDLLVIGGGPGGYTAAFRAADLGLDVTLVEHYDRLGGVCLNVGCIPSKILLHIAEIITEAEAMEKCGVSFSSPNIDPRKINQYKNKTIRRLTGGLNALAKRRRVQVIQGDAVFASAGAIACKGPSGVQTINFEHAIIATGSRPRPLPRLECDDPRFVDSTGALEIGEVPNTMLVIGGGVIGLEMVCVYEALGTQITVVEADSGLMVECDRDLVKPLEKRLAKRGAKIFLKSRVSRVEAKEAGLEVTFDGEAEGTDNLFERVLLSVGRLPNTDTLDVGKVGVALDERGFIPTDAQQRTNVENVFAIGDVTGAPLLAHKATHQGKVAAEVIAGHEAAFDAKTIPAVAYTNPEIAWTGVSETEAERKGIAVQCDKFPWAASGRALGTGAGEGFTKILRDPASKRIIGAGIVGRNAGELIAEMVLALEMGAETADIAASIHPHPTLSETLGLASEMLEKTVTDL